MSSILRLGGTVCPASEAQGVGRSAVFATSSAAPSRRLLGDIASLSGRGRIIIASDSVNFQPIGTTGC